MCKKILIGVTGGIAAYKSADIVSVLYRSYRDVKVVMTENAKKFITPLTLSTLSHNPVFDDQSEWSNSGAIKHIELSRQTDIFIIVPATANTIAKFSLGVADNLLTSIYLAINLKKKIIICPAMNTNMWEKEQFQQHLQTLSLRTNHVIINPEEGELACGDYGIGKLPSTRTIIEKIIKYL